MNRPRTRRRPLSRSALLVPLLLLGACDGARPDPAATVGSGDASVPSGGALVVDAERASRALARGPLDGGVQTGELAFFAARLDADPSDVLALRRLANTHLLRFRAYADPDELDRARDRLSRLARRDEGDAGVLALRTSLALADHDFPGALEAATLRRAAPASDAEGAALGLFDALWASGRYAEARALLERTPSEGESIGRLAREARLVDGLGDIQGAERRMSRVVELVDAYAEPRVVRAWARVEHGHFLLHAGHPSAAAERFDQALALVPAYPAALEGLGWIAYGVDEAPAVAERLFQGAVAAGGHLDLLPILEEIARARGDSAHAVGVREAFVEAARSTPALQALYRRPLALTLAEDPARRTEALQWAETDLAHRQDRMAWATRGWVLHRMGRTDDAVADMERALSWGAPEPEVLYRAGVVLRAAGMERRARALLAEALEGRAELGPVVAGEIDGR